MAIGAELLFHHLQIRQHVVCAGIEQMHQQAGALDMAQEVVAQACTPGRTGNQSGDVGKDGAIATGPAHHAQVWHQGGEGVVGDLGPCR